MKYTPTLWLSMLCTIFIAQISNALAQNPIALDKAVLSGIGLKKIELKDDPNREFFQKRLYRGDEISVYMISSNTASASFDSFAFEEFIYLINGQAHLTPKNGQELFFDTGDIVIAPKGYAGAWETRGGNTYHLELSVISNKRADSTKMSPMKLPFRLDKDIRSGLRLTELPPGDGIKVYKNPILEGVELDISVEAEEPRQIVLNETSKEQFIHILSGMLTLTSASGESHTFYTGDFFVLPKGFTGVWQSQGQGLFRSLKVSQAQ